MPAKQQGREAREAPPPPDIEQPPPPQWRGTSTGFDFYLQTVFEIQKGMGAVEASVKHLCEQSVATDAKLDAAKNDLHDLATEVHGWKKAAWILGGICSVVGAIGLVLLNKILDAVVAHYAAGGVAPGAH